MPNLDHLPHERELDPRIVKQRILSVLLILVGIAGVVFSFKAGHPAPSGGYTPNVPILLLASAVICVGAGLWNHGAFSGTSGLITLIFIPLFVGIGYGWGAGLIAFGILFCALWLGFHWSIEQKGLFGSSRWARLGELKKAGMTQPGGLFLGAVDGTDIYQHGEDSVLTIAPQGAGKSSCLAIPTLLTYPGSVIVTDPKGELAQHTAAVRRGMKQHVVILNPFRQTMAAQSGLDLGDDGFNPLSLFPAGPGMGEAAQTLAGILSPEKPGEDDFFAPASRDLLAALLYFVMTTCTGPDRSIAHVRALLLQPPGPFRAMLEDEWLASDDANLVQFAGSVLGDLESEKQWAGIRRGAINALTIYKDDLAQHVSRGDFPPDIFKRMAVTVYIILPGDKAESHGAWFRLVASVLCQAVGRPGPNYQVLFLCDEFANLGPAHGILKSIALYRSAGLKAWLLVQNLGQLKRLYGDNGWNEIFSLCRTKQFFRVPQGDRELATLISEATGDLTVINPSWNPQEQTRNLGQTGVPLILPADVPRLPDGEQIIFSGNLPAIKGKLVSFRSRPQWPGAAWSAPSQATPASADARPALSPLPFMAAGATISAGMSFISAQGGYNLTGPDFVASMLLGAVFGFAVFFVVIFVGWLTSKVAALIRRAR